MTREKRRRRIRAKIVGTKKRPRLSVFRSRKHIFVQIIDDQSGCTLLACSDKDLQTNQGTKTQRAKMIGEKLAELALKKGIKKIVFDRGGYKYHGRVKALAEAAKEKGLDF